MAEGTRIQRMDERLATQELKMGEISEGLTKTSTEHTQRFVDMELRMERMELKIGKMDSSLLELKELILGLHSSLKDVEGMETLSGTGTGIDTSQSSHSRSENAIVITDQVPHLTPPLSSASMGFNVGISMPLHTNAMLHTLPIVPPSFTSPPNTQFHYAPPTYSNPPLTHPQFQNQTPPFTSMTGTQFNWQPTIPQYRHQFSPPLYTYSTMGTDKDVACLSNNNI
ncbi:hypothetical protein POM88_004049 [Heracleum sosnowskyi]|uniref:Uncharacterized protein n=1 Tax=Heracleum sosnowskyi TaxID=360622 RepID=A0AAD8JJ38_9APIA|nr:hypothetical protein POM88_004049 [Heracleum sosnowskyi]